MKFFTKNKNNYFSFYDIPALENSYVVAIHPETTLVLTSVHRQMTTENFVRGLLEGGGYFRDWADEQIGWNRNFDGTSPSYVPVPRFFRGGTDHTFGLPRIAFA